MAQLKLTPIGLRAGTWRAVLRSDDGSEPKIAVMLHDEVLPDVAIEKSEIEGEWTLSVPVPQHAVADGLQTFVVCDALDDTPLGQFTLLAGTGVGDDIRSELDLLRAELDMLKRAFRRHCAETTGD